MTKRICSLLLAILLAASLLSVSFAAPAEPEESEEAPALTRSAKIFSAQDLLRFAENCRLDSFSMGLEVFLEADIDLTGTDFKGIPIFCGTFRGGNHTIKGLAISHEGSAQGLFRYVSETAVVEQLTVKGQVNPTGSRNLVGGIAGENAGVIRNCGFTGTVSGAEMIGGIVGKNTVSGLIENCRAVGEVYGDHFVGGIAGENAGVIRQSTNRTKVNTVPQQNAVELSDITIESITGAEAANTVTDIGGIAGANGGVIRECKNMGNVGYRHMGYNIGGIAGTQMGSILTCENYGNVEGRKEVGGIVGQMEPTSRITFEEDTLQILERQINALSSTVNQTASNVQTGAQEVESEIYELRDHVNDTQKAVDVFSSELEDYVDELGRIDWSEIMPAPQPPAEGEEPDINIDLPSLPQEKPEDIQLPDPDRLIAASNGISRSLTKMTTSLWDINETTQSAFGSLSNDLYRIQDQMDAMRATLNNAAETTGGSVKDVSDEDTEDDLSGKLLDCINYGAVLADLNAGGIAGAMAMENDLDPEDDWNIIGDNSLNFESEVRAVILSCRNSGTVTVRKQNGGGIAGWQSLGLVKNSLNTGLVDCAGAEFVGGVVGQSDGFLRQNYAKCRIIAGKSVGGIAGSASIATDCRSLTDIEEAAEKIGAVLGVRKESDKEDPVKNNYYLAVEKDLGAIDGISYDGLAQKLTQMTFFSLPDLPEEMKTVTLRFVYEGGNEQKLVFAPGDDLLVGMIPTIPQREGYNSHWEGLDEAQLTDLSFDQTFRAVYTGYDRVLQSDLTREDGRPLLLMQGSFSPAAKVTVAPQAVSPALTEDQTLLESWSIRVSDGEQAQAARLLLPQGVDTKALKLYIAEDDGDWHTVDFTLSGSYLVFPTESEKLMAALVTEKPFPVLPVAAAAASALVILLGVTGIVIRRAKRKKARFDAENIK